MPRKKISVEEKEKLKLQMIYNKIVDGIPLTITELAKFLNKKTTTIRSWEFSGLIKPPHKSENNHRMYNSEDLYEVFKTLMTHEWERNCLNKEEIQKALKYLQILVDIKNTKRG